MFEFENNIMRLLNKYFGDSKNYDQKREIADFIETNTFEINEIINDMKMGAIIKGGVTNCDTSIS